jgi:antitoxin ParD1/3/4
MSDNLQSNQENETLDREWVKMVRVKVEAAIEASKHTPPIDGETLINQILERFQVSDRP